MADVGRVRAAVLKREGYRCIVRMFDADHVCGNRWGEDVPFDDAEALTLEHVRLEPGGTRVDHEAFCVAMCHRANVVTRWGSGWAHRSLLNGHLDGLYPGRREGFPERYQ